MRWPKYWSFSFKIIPSKEHPRLISFRMDWLDLLAVQGTLESLLQHHSSKASILRCSAFFITSWQIDGETVADFILGGSKITADGNCSHEIKGHLLLGRKATTNFSSVQSLSRVQLLHLHVTSGKVALTMWIYVGKVMFLLFNMLSRLVITFLPRSKHLLISWLQSPSAVILEPPSKV